MQRLKQKYAVSILSWVSAHIFVQQVDPILQTRWITASLLNLQLSVSFITRHLSSITRISIAAWSSDQVETRLPVNL
jgi:hypothetical protein